jgi:hypothetical protein
MLNYPAVTVFDVTAASTLLVEAVSEPEQAPLAVQRAVLHVLGVAAGQVVLQQLKSPLNRTSFVYVLR